MATSQEPEQVGGERQVIVEEGLTINEAMEKITQIDVDREEDLLEALMKKEIAEIYYKLSPED